MDKKILGIDIGGSSVKYGIVDHNGAITDRDTFPVSPDMGREAFLNRLTLVCTEAKAKGIQGLGISSLGFVDSHIGVITDGAENLPFLIHLNLKDALGSLFPREHISIHNDADCFALGELWKGNAQDVKNFFCLALGTGMGGSLVMDKMLIQGTHFRTGEVGYFDYTDPENYWEKKYSTKTYMALAGKHLGSASLTGEEFMTRIREGAPLYMEAFRHWMDEIGKKLANIILLLDVDCIIIGGAVSKSSDILIPALTQAVNAGLPPAFRGQCAIRPARFYNDSAIIGAVAPFMTEH